ncbi:hemin uptake protein HemP [Salinarimonas sp.]|uniref:hemin uptake protein HemP n=1 Tax=Salinarimonas sp. TaxID=2766526 RepID=UPI0032D9A400
MGSKEEPKAAGAPGPDGPPVIEVRALVGEGREAVIRHNGESYRLRITAANKLILTK